MSDPNKYDRQNIAARVLAAIVDIDNSTPMSEEVDLAIHYADALLAALRESEAQSGE